MDILAGKLGLDAVEFRRLNALDVGSTTVTGQVMRESVGLHECIDKVDADMRGGDFRWTWDEGHKRFAWGLAIGYKNTGLGGGAPDKATPKSRLGRTRTRAWLPRFESPPPKWARDCRACSQPARPKNWASRPATSTCCSATPMSVPTAARPRPAARPSSAAMPHGSPHAMSAQKLADCTRNQALSQRHEYWAPKTQPLGTGGDMHVAFSFCAQAALCEIDMRHRRGAGPQGSSPRTMSGAPSTR